MTAIYWCELNQQIVERKFKLFRYMVAWSRPIVRGWGVPPWEIGPTTTFIGYLDGEPSYYGDWAWCAGEIA